jgi:hypothetical protein
VKLLSDMRKITAFIKNGTPCPTVLIIEHYLMCKRDGVEVPARIDDFISDCLKRILIAANHGNKPMYDDIFNIKFKRGRNARRESVMLDIISKIGSTVEDIMDDMKVNKIKPTQKCEAPLHIEKAADKLCIGVETTKKALTKFKKI